MKDLTSTILRFSIMAAAALGTAAAVYFWASPKHQEVDSNFSFFMVGERTDRGESGVQGGGTKNLSRGGQVKS